MSPSFHQPSEPLSAGSLSSNSSSASGRVALRVRALGALRAHVGPDGAPALAAADASLHKVLAEGVERLREVEAANEGLRALVRARDADAVAANAKIAALEAEVRKWRTGAEAARMRTEVEDVERRFKKVEGEFRVAEAAGVAARAEVGVLRGKGLQEAGGAKGRMKGVGGGGVKQQGGRPEAPRPGGREGRSWSMSGGEGGRRVLGGIENLGGKFRQLSFGSGKAGDRDSGRSARNSRKGRTGA